MRGIKPGTGEPVVVALSGGVDSAVCAGLLVEAGYRVIGVSMRLYNAAGTTSAAGGRCCGPRDMEDARAICAHFGIPFYVANYEEDFKKAVIDDFVQTYQQGRTPNPCVKCNQHIKFTPLLSMSKALGAVGLCTGHYACLEQDAGSGELQLKRGRDVKKDQSYFLFAMPKEELRYIHFPLGHLTKEEVRAHAARLGLPNAQKPESQEICFVPDGNHAAFIAKQHAGGASEVSGDIVNEDGQVVGKHQGVHGFTIGQRRGIGVGLGEKQYVVHIDALRRKVHIGAKEKLDKKHAMVEEVSWFEKEQGAKKVIFAQVQIRYRHPAVPARLELQEGGVVRVDFENAESAVTPGQAAVFYQGEVVLGGGFIANSQP